MASSNLFGIISKFFGTTARSDAIYAHARASRIWIPSIRDTAKKLIESYHSEDLERKLTERAHDRHSSGCTCVLAR